MSHLYLCYDVTYNIMWHMYCPEESRVNQLPRFAQISYFDILREDEFKSLFVKVNRGYKKYTQSIAK